MAQSVTSLHRRIAISHRLYLSCINKNGHVKIALGNITGKEVDITECEAHWPSSLQVLMSTDS